MQENTPTSFPGHSPSPETIRKVPNDSEGFRTIPNNAEIFGSVPHDTERKENHTLTVRKAAKLFEAAGVARTERSIVNWCQPNRQGVARLDCYFDPNERKYYLTPESVERAIQEELAKGTKTTPVTETVGTIPQDSEHDLKSPTEDSEAKTDSARELEREVIDLKIANRSKDYFIELLQKEREEFSVERQGYVEKLIESNRKVGELETRLLQLEGPRSGNGRRLEVRSEDNPAHNES